MTLLSRIFLILIVFIATPCYSEDDTEIICVGFGESEGGTCTSTCTQDFDGSTCGNEDNGGSTDYISLGVNNTNQWVASKFVAEDTVTICELKVQIFKNGSPTGTVTACIYSHDAGNDEPQSLVGTCSDARDADDMGLNYLSGWRTFAGLSAGITNGTTYWVLWHTSAIDSSNYLRLGSSTSGTTERVEGSGDGTDDSWSNLSSTVTIRYLLRK